MPRGPKEVKTSQYMYVCFSTRDNIWFAQYKNKFRKRYDTEREAALGVDKFLLTIGEQPVNILKPKP